MSESKACFCRVFMGILSLACCPEFSQDKVNFHKMPGGDTTGRADSNWPKKTGSLIPCAIMLVSEWGSWTGGG